jgi:ABC-2 type transport system permease protein
MNAVAQTPAAIAAKPATHTFRLLLKREFWENRGGFLWAPLIAGGISILFGILASITGVIAMREAMENGGSPWDELEFGSNQGPDAVDHLIGFMGDINLMSGIGLAYFVMVFVVFFYALGSLYDERKDRSVLFWKSLPVSDTQTVLSKAVWALVLAPLLSAVIGLAIGFALWIIGTLSMMIGGIPGSAAGFTEAHPFRILTNVLGALPIYTLWALPTVGWLMLCSAWARSKPFVWAVLLPILVACVISWLDTLPGIEIRHDIVWYVLGFRGLLSIVPGTWYLNETVNSAHTVDINGPQDLPQLVDFSSSWNALATVDLWVGAALGMAMIYTAIRLRRWRDEG